MLTADLPHYPAHELSQILLGKHIEEKTAAIMVKAYLNKLEEGKNEKHSPLPTVRDLNNVADDYQVKSQDELQLPGIFSLFGQANTYQQLSQPSHLHIRHTI